MKQATLHGIARLTAGAVASLTLQWILPPEAAGSLRSSLIFLPCVIAALWELEIFCRRGGGRGVQPGISQAQLLAIAGLAAASLYQDDLGLALASPVLACGFMLVLAHRVGYQLLAARPLLGRSLPERPSAIFFFLPLVVYLALLPWSASQRPLDGDEPYYLLVAHSLAFDYDADLTNNYLLDDGRFFLDRPLEPQPGDPRGPKGELYSRHNHILPLLLAPAYRLAGKMGALAVMAWLTAWLAWASLRLARRYFPDHPGEALAAFALVAFTPPVLLYSSQIWVEIPAALLCVLVLDRIPRSATIDLWSRRQWLALGIPILLLPLVKIRFMLLAGSLLLIAWWYARRPWRPLVVLFFCLALLGGGILAFNTVRYGNPLKIHSLEELALHQRTAADYAEGGLGLFFDSAFGLFPSSPIWLLVLPALLLAMTRKGPIVRDLAFLSVPYLMIVAPRGEWYGGWSPPFRYGLFMLPLLAIVTIPLLVRRRRPGARILLASLGLVTLLLTALWLAVPGWTYNFADGRTYLLDHLSRLLQADVARLFPSSVRPRLATWLWPPLVTAGVAWLWWWPRRKAGSWRNLTSARQAGVVLSFLGLGFVPLIAISLPTHRVEFEDTQVTKVQGYLFPDRWVIERTRYRGGWVLRPGESVSAPIVAGGKKVSLEFDLQFISNSDWPIRLLVRAGDRVVGRWRPQKSRTWSQWNLEDLDWIPGEKLMLEVVAASPRREREMNGIVVDRVKLQWQD